jgi:uncharacterized membrane protein
MKIIFQILLALFGIFLFIFGGYDDSPGAQGLGLLLFILAIFLLVRNRKKK